MSAYLGKLQLFDHKSSEWQIFKGKLVQFLKINKVADEETKIGVLLTHVTDETYRLVRNLAYPQELESLSYAELVTLLDCHFKVRQCSFADKAKFYGASRSPGESLGDWAARLRGLATYCDFGTALETNLVDRFVLGLGPGAEREKLFEQKPLSLTLTRAIELAEQAECAKKAKTLPAMNEVQVKEEPLFRAKFEGRSSRAAQPRKGRAGGSVSGGDSAKLRDTSRCRVCGLKNHKSDQCFYKGYKCKKCFKKGHLQKACTSGNSGIYHVDDEQVPLEGQEICEECQNFNVRYVGDKPILLNLTLGNKNVTMELDSGSSVCVISDVFFKDKFLNYKLTKSNIKMCMYSGHKISPLGYFIIEATFNNLKKKIRVFVIKDGGPPLLGRDFMSAFNLIITTKINSLCEDTDVHSLLEKFADLWRDELGSFNKFKVKLQLKDNSVPKFFKSRTVPFALKDKVERELHRLVSVGILVPVSYSQYATPIVPVLKANGQVKIAGDFSITLNRDLLIEKYPLPRIEEVFAKIGGGERYSKIDLKNAYNQFVLDESSQELTTINTHKGLYKYTRLVYGLANAPAIFQKSMETLLSGIEGVSVWLDDICITGPDRNSHLQRLGEVLSRLCNAGLRLEKTKCEFFKKSVTYLGYVINKAGLSTCPDKVKAIINAPEPNNVSDVKRFLGVINYYRNFIPNASALLSPLHELLRSDAPWEWGKRQRKSVAAVRQHLASERVLAHFEPGAQLALAVDASPGGLGAVLSQRADDGTERPLAYASRSLTASERNYSQIQKEATAIIFGVKRFHQYLYGCQEPFILKTDHRPLVSIFNSKTGIPVTTALRLQRYAIILSAYNYTVQYVSSDNNTVADYFSRAPLKSNGETIEQDDVDAHYALKFLDETSVATTIRDIIQTTERDATLQTVIKYMNRGWPRKITCKLVLPYFHCKSDLQFENGCLFRGHRIVIPSVLRKKMLHELHDSHLGIVKCKSNARQRMWWPEMDAQIERWIGSCGTCVQARPAPPRAPPAPWPAAAGPWQRVHIDYMTVEQKVYLVVVDSFSKWVECVYMHKGTSTKDLIGKLKIIFSTFGIPEILISDNDVKINSNEFKSFCSSNGIRYMTTPIYHPPSNGQAENSVRTCKKMLKCILKDSMSLQQAHELLLGYLFNYRNTVHCTTGKTPAMLMFGRNLRSRLDLILPSSTGQFEKQAIPGKRHFHTGDVVWTRWYSARKETWQLGSIRARIGNRMYKVFIHDLQVCCIRHVDQIFRYTGSSDVQSESYQSLAPSSTSETTNANDQNLTSSPANTQCSVEPASSVEIETDEARVTSPPDAVCESDDSDGEEWGDCEEGGSERGLGVSPREAADPVEGLPAAREQASVASAPPPPSPTLPCQKRNRKAVDYKQYF